MGESKEPIDISSIRSKMGDNVGEKSVKSIYKESVTNIEDPLAKNLKAQLAEVKRQIAKFGVKVDLLLIELGDAKQEKEWPNINQRLQECLNQRQVFMEKRDELEASIKKIEQSK
jgi:hypothetical protein